MLRCCMPGQGDPAAQARAQPVWQVLALLARQAPASRRLRCSRLRGFSSEVRGRLQEQERPPPLLLVRAATHCAKYFGDELGALPAACSCVLQSGAPPGQSERAAADFVAAASNGRYTWRGVHSAYAVALQVSAHQPATIPALRAAACTVCTAHLMDCAWHVNSSCHALPGLCISDAPRPHSGTTCCWAAERLNRF